MKIAVIGAGGWGTALALHLDSIGHETALWAHSPETIRAIADSPSRENAKYLPGVRVPERILATSDRAAAAAGAELVVMAVPSRHSRAVCAGFRGAVEPGAIAVSVSKGFCPETLRRLAETSAEAMGLADAVALSGPSHAEEVARGIPTALVAASADIALAKKTQEVFTGARLRVYASTDIAGVELGGAVKNILALAVGMSDGLGFGDNSRAALITRGLAEMARFGVAMGGRAETFAGLSGLGDLVATCTSRHSRNRGVGERLGRGETLPQIEAGMRQVAEGVCNCRLVAQLAEERAIPMPICATVLEVLDGRLAPADALPLLMSRDTKHEDFG